MKYAIFAMALLFSQPAFAFSNDIIDVGSASRDPLVAMTVTDPAHVAPKRAALFSTIFGPNGIPASTAQFDGHGNGGDPQGYFDASGMFYTYWHKWEMPIGSHTLIARTMTTKFTGSTCLLAVNGGHGQRYFPIGGSGTYPTVDTLVRQLDGTCDVILSSIPLQGENYAFGDASYINPPPTPSDPHGWIGAQTVNDGGTALKYFLIPAMGAMNEAIVGRAAASLPDYEKIVVLGVSGGGQATMMISALDPRVTHSFAIAGGVPLEWRHGGDYGDWEQRNVSIDYLDLFALSTGAGRESYLMYNGLDSCCFKANAVWPWAPELVEHLEPFPGEFGILIDWKNDAHSISDRMRAAIIELIN